MITWSYYYYSNIYFQVPLVGVASIGRSEAISPWTLFGNISIFSDGLAGSARIIVSLSILPDLVQHFFGYTPK